MLGEVKGLSDVELTDMMANNDLFTFDQLNQAREYWDSLPATFIPDPTMVEEEIKVDPAAFEEFDVDKFLSPATALPLGIDAATPNLGEQNKVESLGAGGYIVILIFLSLLMYIMRKCYLIDPNSHRNSKDGKMNDHLSSLL